MDMRKYYARRAGEYEAIYGRKEPGRQREQRKIAADLGLCLTGRKVLEIACGTGYWTQPLSQTARRIVATDVNIEVLNIAKAKTYGCPVSFQKRDAYSLGIKSSTFDGGLANFWFSHIPKYRIDEFLKEFHKTLKPGAIVFMADNVYIEGIGGTLLNLPGDENTYKKRQLLDGSVNRVLKNYYQADELAEIFSRYDPSFTTGCINYGKAFWWLSYQPKKQ